MKYINFKRYKFSTVVKSFNRLIYNFLKFFKFGHLKRYEFKKVYKYFNFSRYNISKYLSFESLSIYRIKKINFINYKFLLFHLPASIIFFGLLYLIIPTFYNYDKSNIENAICKNINAKCSIKGKINYSFYPTPRIKIKNLIIKDSLKEKKTLMTVKDTAVKLSIKNLLTKEKHQVNKIKLNNFEININLRNLKKYKNIFIKKIDLTPIFFNEGKIIFFDGKEYVATINDANLNLEFVKHSIEGTLKGKFLGDNIHINLNRTKTDNKELATEVMLKMSETNLLAKAKLFNFEKKNNTTSGNILIKKDKNKITAIFDYKNNEITINKSNLRNTFLDGKLEGKIKLLPYFNFNLDLSLNSINFTKLYNHFLALNEKDQKGIFKINNKINGKLNLSSDKVYSKYNLIKSFESRIKFNNSSISIEQLLINLGKLGAADVLGAINSDKKFTNFKFESNIFVDNQKKFLSKFGIYNKDSIPSNLFVSGNFDLDKLKSSFYEISNDKKFSDSDVDYIEKEFNNLMFEYGYKSLFHFPNFKEFIKSVTSTVN